MGSKMGIKIAGIQLGPYSGDYDNHATKMVTLFEKAAHRGPDIICFPELMNVPYFCCTRDNRYFRLAETINGPTIKTFVDLSRKYNTFVIATLFERNKNSYFNSAVLISPHKGINGVYRKVHIPKTQIRSFFADETYYFSSGKDLPVYQFGKNRIGILICFDRSFPESFRVLMLKGAQIIFVPVASFGFRGQTFIDELKIRAIENNIFIVAVNKAGHEFLEKEPRKRHHFGKSCIINPRGEIIAKLNDEPDEILFAKINLKEIRKAKGVMDWLKFRKPRLYKIIAQKMNRQERT